jgi:hypothetical protein
MKLKIAIIAALFATPAVAQQQQTDPLISACQQFAAQDASIARGQALELFKQVQALGTKLQAAEARVKEFEKKAATETPATQP